MTAEERAKALLAKAAPGGRLRWDAEITAEEFIRAAENEALERAAAVVSEPLGRLDGAPGPYHQVMTDVLRVVLGSMASNVRSLKSSPGVSGKDGSASHE